MEFSVKLDKGFFTLNGTVMQQMLLCYCPTGSLMKPCNIWDQFYIGLTLNKIVTHVENMMKLLVVTELYVNYIIVRWKSSK